MRLVIGGDFPQRSRPRQIGVALGQHSDMRDGPTQLSRRPPGAAASRRAQSKDPEISLWATGYLLNRPLEFGVAFTDNSIAAGSLRGIETGIGTLHQGNRRLSLAELRYAD